MRIRVADGELVRPEGSKLAALYSDLAAPSGEADAGADHEGIQGTLMGRPPLFTAHPPGMPARPV
ncbi:MAG: hypothetical protein ACXWKQ_07540, partial [Reyranella sp.]